MFVPLLLTSRWMGFTIKAIIISENVSGSIKILFFDLYRDERFPLHPVYIHCAVSKILRCRSSARFRICITIALWYSKLDDSWSYNCYSLLSLMVMEVPSRIGCGYYILGHCLGLPAGPTEYCSTSCCGLVFWGSLILKVAPWDGFCCQRILVMETIPQSFL